MLSLLSLLLASGTVLRADTERWTPLSYPNPKRNHTACNTWEDSTLCDPDHILTDQWRSLINENIQRQMKRLAEANVPLTEKAPVECANRSEGVTIYVLLAKRIWVPNNQSITGNDLTNFGDELAKKYGLNELPCKTFLLLIGIEAAKLAYVRTGKDLRLPADLMQQVFHQYKLFNAKNFMAGLNKIVDEIGEQMSDPFKKSSTTASISRLGNNATSTSTDASTLAEIVASLEGREAQQQKNGTNMAAVDREVGHQHGNNERRRLGGGGAPLWMFLSLGTAIGLAFGSLALLALAQQRRRAAQLAGRAHQLQKTATTHLRGSSRGTGDCQQQGQKTADDGVCSSEDGDYEGGAHQQGAAGARKGNDDELCSISTLCSQSDDLDDDNNKVEERVPRVRIDAAELATDVIG